MFAAASPAKQSVSETITVLSGRLSSSTLLEDRRAAIQGLRSFAKDYPASVASGALRSLIGSLSKDGEDVDTVKVVLETLLMLFSPNPQSAEASEEIALWVADEFTMRQDNVSLLVGFLETGDFYARLYSLQLLAAILSARTERTEECILTAPLGIPRLVAVLDERREVVRNEAIALLTYLTPSNPDIQKLVVFENALERVFAIIGQEGGIKEGDRIVEDCLILLANLLRLNTSNQSTFRETGCVQRLSMLLETSYRGGDSGTAQKGDKEGGDGQQEEEEEVAQWAQDQRNRNIYALLAIVRLFLVGAGGGGGSGGSALGTAQNQASFWQHGVLYHALQLAFSYSAPDRLPIRAEALNTCADMIRGNQKLQENFAQLQVPSVLDSPPSNSNNKMAHVITPVYVIDSLLDLTLSVPSLAAFDLRLAACQCLKAYFHNHPEIRLHFLRRAIEGHSSGRDETANVLTTVLEPIPTNSPIDPYRPWFAAVVLLHLIYENPDTKALIMAVTEGDADSGEEVVTTIQTITAHLITALTRALDPRIAIAYLMLLIAWLFEDHDAVNDFLSEGSNIQGLLTYIVTPQPAATPASTDENTTVQGLCAMLLAIVYEFSTKESPIPRLTLHSILLSKLPLDRYIDVLSQLRTHPFMREFEVLPQKLLSHGADTPLPEVFFDPTFVDFCKDNYSRLLRAVDRDPGLEVSVVTNGVQKGVSRELVDSLRNQLEERDAKMQSMVADLGTLQARIAQEQAERQRVWEEKEMEMERVREEGREGVRRYGGEVEQLKAQQRALEQTHKSHLDAQAREAALATNNHRKEFQDREIELQKQIQAARQEMESVRAECQGKETEWRRQMEYVKKSLEAEAGRAVRGKEAEVADLRGTLGRLEVELMKANQAITKATEQHAAELQNLRADLKTESEKRKDAEEKARRAEASVQQVERAGSEKESEMNGKLKAKDDEKATIQTELEDLLMVFADTEDKLKKYKERLKELGQEVSDDDDDNDDNDDNDDDDDDDDEEDEDESEGEDEDDDGDEAKSKGEGDLD